MGKIRWKNMQKTCSDFLKNILFVFNFMILKIKLQSAECIVIRVARGVVLNLLKADNGNLSHNAQGKA